MHCQYSLEIILHNNNDDDDVRRETVPARCEVSCTYVHSQSGIDMLDAIHYRPSKLAYTNNNGSRMTIEMSDEQMPHRSVINSKLFIARGCSGGGIVRVGMGGWYGKGGCVARGRSGGGVVRGGRGGGVVLLTYKHCTT